eukprot:9473188-Pyramimonas_sp.AAC.1
MAPNTPTKTWRTTQPYAAGNTAVVGGTLGEAHHAATNTGWGRRMRAAPLGHSAKLHMGPRKLYSAGETHAGFAPWTVGGAPYVAAKR